MKNKTLILFGAGASYGNTEDCNGTPPQGKDLYSRLEIYSHQINKLPIAVKSLFKIYSFEEAMNKLPNSSTLINPIQKATADYLSSFKPTKKTGYSKLFRMLDNPLNIDIATLNYDILIELSLDNIGIPYSQFYEKAHNINLIKVHGSSSYLPNIGNNRFDDVVFENCSSFIEGLDINIAQNHSQIKEWCNQSKNNSISPCLCLYNQDKKTVINRNLIESIQKQYKRSVLNCKRIFVIGVSLAEHDLHIWSPLLETKAEIVIVDPSPNAAYNWLKIKKKGSVRKIESGFYKAAGDVARIINKDK